MNLPRHGRSQSGAKRPAPSIEMPTMIKMKITKPKVSSVSVSFAFSRTAVLIRVQQANIDLDNQMAGPHQIKFRQPI